MDWRGAAVIVAIGMLGLQATACAKAPPLAAPEPQIPLEVPVPPPRVLAPAAPEIVAEVPPASDVSAVDTTPSSSPPTAAAGPRAPQRPNPPAANAGTGAAPTEVPPQDEAGPAQPTLRTPQTANEAETERRIRDVLARAARGLEAVSRVQLSADARAQFDTARRFIGQATDALSARNFMFAAYLADKAETLARGLAGR